jgi:putative multiple sugar transport system ATP-binding protein
MGAGRTELALSIFGNTPKYSITSGELSIDGKAMKFPHPKAALDAGIAYVSEDRKGNGLVLIQDIKYNITLSNLEHLTEGFTINENKEINVAKEYQTSINIKAPSIKQLVGNLSGGNQQKVSLAKCLFVNPKVLILDEPTRGIDVGAKFEIYSIMNRLVEQGMSIIMISSELLEVLGMSDRVYVMSEGTITGCLSAEEATEQSVMAMATRVEEVAQ